MSSPTNSAALEGIAIVGMACRFPGARNIDEFWHNLKTGVESISSFSDQELLASGVPPALLRNPNYVKAGAVLEDIDQFDAAFFGFNRREAEILDPQQRLFLECAYQALEHAGYDSERYTGSIGVYAGVGANTYLSNVLANPELVEVVGHYQLSLANEKDFLATRIAYKLNLKGPALTVQTACSTALVATHLGCQSLLNFDCDMVVVGGAAVSIPQKVGYLYQEGGIVAPDGHCRAFDAKAAGTVSGNGVGVVVLKRVADALADGDPIHAVIRSSAINNDGSLKVGFTAPSQDGQAAVIEEALTLAGVEPETISYIEAHGTGTAVGDPIEIAALTQVYGHSTNGQKHCAIGSVKTNIGHLDAAAGIAGLIKTVLALKHQQIPPSLHFEQPNPRIDFEHSPFYVAQQLLDWEVQDQPRRAGVSSFGIGGTNAHLILEEAPATEPAAAARPAQILVLSAKTPAALDAATKNLADHLKQKPDANLAQVAYTLYAGRKVFPHRRTIVCRDHAEAVAVLEKSHPRHVFTATAEQGSHPITFLFPGQGAQYVNMATELYRAEPVFQQHLDRCADLLVPLLNLDLRDVLYPDQQQVAAATEQLTQTLITQAAVFTVDYALAQLWISWGLQPQALIGHSIGEYVAATLAEVFSLEDALRLVVARGRLMQSLPQGAMVVVPLPEQELQPFLGSSLALAAVNGPAVCVVAGEPTAVTALVQQLGERGVECRPLHVSHAFHSSMMDPILDEFTAQVRQVRLHEPRIAYVSNVTGTWITAAEAQDPAYWAKHLRQTVRFSDGLQTLFADPKRLLLEVGPGHTLTTLARRHPNKPTDQIVVASLPKPTDQSSDMIAILAALGQLWAAGIAVDWEAFYANQPCERIPLPTYPFERERYWISAPYETDPALLKLQTEISMSEPQTVAQPASQRHSQIVTTLSTLINGLTGITPDEIDGDISLFDIGFDSLILIQFNQAIQDALGVKVSLVQLLEQYTTLNSIAAYIDEQLPPEDLAAPTPPAAPAPPTATLLSAPAVEVAAPARPVAAQPTVQPVAVAAPAAPQPVTAIVPVPAVPDGSVAVPASYSVVEAVGNNSLERIMSQQIQLLSQQLDLLRGVPTTVLSAPAPTAPALQPQAVPTLPANQASAAPTAAPAASPPPAQAQPEMVAPAATQTTDKRKIQTATFVPYKPAEVNLSGDLTPRQKQYLEEFTARYVKRTQGSKRMTQHYRAALADSRSSVAFRLIWKELVYPIIGRRSAGSRIWDVDNNEYIDYTMGFGVHLFGHSPRFIMEAMEEQMKIGVQLGPQSYLAGEVAKVLCELTGTERANFCNSGTEAVMGAIRIARTITRRTKIACFAGSYHGWFDGILGRPLMRDGKLQTVSMVPGVPQHAVEDLLILEYDNPQSLEVLKAHAHELAAVLVEPVQSRRPDLQPREFLHSLRELTAQANIPLIFDEMVNGFRIHPGGAQAWFGVQADIVTYGKIVGGGLPIGVIAGKAAYMDAFDGGWWDYNDSSFPQTEKTMFAGAFFKHPLTMAAALAVLNHMKAHGPALHEQLNQRTARLVETLNTYFEQQQVPIEVVSFSSVFRFNIAPEAKYLDLFFYHLIDKGIYIWEGTNFFLSTAHTDEDIEAFIRAAKESIEDLRRGGFLPELPPDSSNGQAGGSRQQVVAATASTDAHGSATASVRSLAPATTPSAALTTGRTSQQLQFSLYYFGNYDSSFNDNKYDLLLKGTKFADSQDFTAVWFPERHFHSFGGFSPNPSVVAAALARETERIQLRAGSVALPLHHPIRVAEEWSIVDNLSNGRVGISFASGWHPDDFVFAPEAYENRREIMLEGIATVRKLWRGEGIRVRGGAQSSIEARLHPMPRQAELPVWLTCVQKETYIKAGEIGAGVLTNLLDQSPEELAEKIRLYRQALAQHGHDPERGHVTLLVHTFLANSVGTAIQQARQPFYRYLRSSLGLVRNMVASKGGKIDVDRMTEEELNYLLADAYERIVQTGTLIGTPESCAPLLDTLIASGVNEIACLIDFGVDTPSVLDSLQRLTTLKNRYAQRAEAAAGSAPIASSSSASVAADELRLPLTEPQNGLWVLSQLEGDEARLYNEPLTLRLLGSLDVSAIRKAFQSIVDRHESLRTIFSPDGEYQQVLPALEIDVPLVDLSELDPGQRQERATALVEAHAREAFDLVSGPLLRVQLIKLGAEEHILALAIHHIITDGWSTDIILQELSTLYAAATQGTSADLPTPLQFRDYLAWLDQQNQDADAERYWLDQFASPVPGLELPGDRPRPPRRTYNGAQYNATIGADLIAKLRSFSSQQRSTLFMTLLAGFNTLLHRLSGQDDLVVGVPAAGQLAMGGKYLTGDCLNLLPLRSTIDRRISFTDYLGRVRRTLSEGYAHQHYSFNTLVRKLELARDMSRPPLVSVVFNLEKGTMTGGLPMGDLVCEPMSSFSGFARFDMNVNVYDLGDTVTLQCDYNTDLFSQTTIERWIEHFQTLLAGIVANPASELAELPLLSAAEREELLVTRNATAADYPADRCFHQLFETQVEQTPDAIAVSFTGAEESAQELTYRELDQRANQLAHYLQTLGVGPEARVGVCFERSLELVVGLLGIFKAGGAFVPLDPSFPQERMSYILEDAQAVVVLTQAHLQSRLPDYPAPRVNLDQDWPTISQAATTTPHSTVSAENLAYQIYTSGSTGKPKGVLIPHRGLVNYLHWCIDAYGAASGRGAPVHASIAADAIFPSLFAPLLVGTTVVIMPEEHALEALGEAIQHEGPFSLVKITPSQLEVLNQQLPQTDASGWVNTFVIGAEEVRGEVLTFWQQHAPDTILLNEYGPTETVVGCSIYQVPRGQRIQGTVPIGLPIANITFYVLDPQMQPVPIGVPGELYIGGDGVAWGYHNRQDLTARQFVPDPFSSVAGARMYKTGDLVRYIADRAGNVEFLGRIDDQVKIRGYRVEPGEVAEAIAEHPGVREVVVLARNDGAGGKRLIAYIVPNQPQPPIAELRSFLQHKLLDYMIPSAYLFLDAIPLAPHGKIDRNALPMPDTTRPDLEVAFVAPETSVEQQIAEIWSRLLDVEHIGVHDSFFDLGGNSLLAVRAISRLRDAFQVELPARTLFENPTIAELGLEIAQRLAEDIDDETVAALLAEMDTLPEDALQILLSDN